MNDPPRLLANALTNIETQCYDDPEIKSNLPDTHPGWTIIHSGKGRKDLYNSEIDVMIAEQDQRMEERKGQSQQAHVFMDGEYNQYEIESESMGDAINYVEDGMPCEVVFYNEKAISVELPNTIVREVVYTEPAVRGDTSGKVMKPAKINTGFELPVAAFVEIGDKIEIDTRTNEFKKRA